MDNNIETEISGDGTPAYRICPDGTCSTAPSYITATSTIDNNEYLQLRMTSNATPTSTNSATMTIGSFSDIWSILTSIFEMDYMEYATDGAAQTAYGTSATAYTSQTLPA